MRGLRLPALLLALPALASPTHALADATLAEPHVSERDDADEAYAFVAGLAERGLHEQVVREGRKFLEDFPRHAKAPLARYRLADALFELGRRGEAEPEYERLTRVEGFEFAAEAWFRLGQCRLAAGALEPATVAFERALRAGKAYLERPAHFFLAESLFRADRFEDAEPHYEASTRGDEEGEYGRDARYGLLWCAARRADHEQTLRRAEAFLARRDVRADAELSGEARFLAGEALLALGRVDDALQSFGAIREGPFVAAALRGSAFGLAKRGDHRQAAQTFERFLERHPEDEHAAEAALHRGIEWLRAEDPARARDALEDPRVGGGADALYWRARARLETQDAEGALQAAEAALRAQPGEELRGRLQTVRGDALSALGRTSEAVKAYENAGSEYSLYAAAIEALNDGRHPEALRLANTLLSQHPESEYRAEMHLTAGESLLAAGLAGEAAAAFAAAVEAGPPPALVARALARQAWCQLALGDAEGAARGFRRVLEQHAEAPEAEESTFLLARALEKGADAEGALRAYRRYLERYPRGSRRAEALFALGIASDTAEGRRWLEQLVDEAPENALSADALLELAERYQRAGDAAAAAAAFERVLASFPNSASEPRACYGLAWCRFEAGDVQGAQSALNTLLERRGLPGDLRLAALELRVWTTGKAGDASAVRRAWREYAEAAGASGGDPKLLTAARAAIAGLRERGELREAQALVVDLLGRVEEPETTLAALVEGAWLGLDSERLDEAEAALAAAAELARQGQSPLRADVGEVAFFVGEARFAAEQYTEAAAHYALAAELGAGELVARAWYKRGFALLRTDDPRAAAAAFARVSAEHPRSELAGEAGYLAGEALFRADEFAAAVPHLAAVVESNPRHDVAPKALFRLGVACGRLERWEECQTYLSRLLRANPEFENAAEAELWRGRALAHQGSARAARSAFERVIAIDKGVLAARARLGLGELALAADDPDEALSQFLKVALLFAHADEVAEATFLAGTCLERMEDLEGARQQYREVVEKHAQSRFAELARNRLAELPQ